MEASATHKVRLCGGGRIGRQRSEFTKLFEKAQELPVEILCDNPASAKSLRFSLYRILKDHELCWNLQFRLRDSSVIIEYFPLIHLEEINEIL